MRKKIERAVFVAVALLTLAIVSVSIYFEQQISNQKTMYYQLQAIRTSVNLYKAINKKNPKELWQLEVEDYRFPGEEERRKFLQGFDTDDERRVLDPFGNPYVYDAMTGWVRSSTKGYEYW